jgi:hypothetical protein
MRFVCSRRSPSAICDVASRSQHDASGQSAWQRSPLDSARGNFFIFLLLSLVDEAFSELDDGGSKCGDCGEHVVCPSCYQTQTICGYFLPYVWQQAADLKLFRTSTYCDGKDSRRTAQNWSIVDAPKQSFGGQIKIQLPNTTDIKPNMLLRRTEMDPKKGGSQSFSGEWSRFRDLG